MSESLPSDIPDLWTIVQAVAAPWLNAHPNQPGIAPVSLLQLQRQFLKVTDWDLVLNQLTDARFITIVRVPMSVEGAEVQAGGDDRSTLSLVYLTTHAHEVLRASESQRKERASQVARLKGTLAEVEATIQDQGCSGSAEDDREKETMPVDVDEYIHQLHEYNELKDLGQMVIGKCAMLDNTTTKETYGKFDLDLED